MYVKPTDTHQYLLSTSCHPSHTKRSIPYSLALRLRRICSHDNTFTKRTNELLQYLTNRGYKRKHVRNEIRKASNVTRQDSLENKHRSKNTRTPFVVTYHPGLPQLATVLKRHQHILDNSDKCKEAFPQPPMLCHRRPKNLRDHLVRAKLKGNDTTPLEVYTTATKTVSHVNMYMTGLPQLLLPIQTKRFTFDKTLNATLTMLYTCYNVSSV